MSDETPGLALTATGQLRAATEAVQQFCRMTLWERDQEPVDTADQLAELAALAAALPQALSQINTILQAALEDQVLSMDTLTEETDPSMAIGVAELHIDEARDQALNLYKSLDAAQQPVAHIISDGVPETLELGDEDTTERE